MRSSLMAGLARLFFGCAVASSACAADNEPADLWKVLQRGGAVVLVRHASTEAGIGDPPGFKVDDCATQRNLSSAGREESRRLGAAFRKYGIQVGKLYASPWCRTLETARLAFGEPQVLESLASGFNDPSRVQARAESIKQLISRQAAELPRGANIVMVTHMVNIQAISGRSVAMGEVVVLKPDGCCNHRVLGVLPAM